MMQLPSQLFGAMPPCTITQRRTDASRNLQSEQLILPDTFFVEAAFPLTDVLLDPGREGGSLRRKGGRNLP